MAFFEFDVFVGIDWSGAKGEFQAGLSVFTAFKGTDAPIRIKPPSGRYWSRQAIKNYLGELSADKRVLAGIDFAFAYPVTDEDEQHCGYFPGYSNAPHHAADLWALIEQKNQNQPHFYGGGIWDDKKLGPYYNAPMGRRGRLFRSRRRLTEQAARVVKSPSPTFNCVGPAGVGTGSLAGMRLLHALFHKAHIWPFSDVATGSRSLYLVEIFPSYYFALAGIQTVKGAHGQVENINKALHAFDSVSVSSSFSAAGPDYDEADALVSAAALRFFAQQADFWQTPEQASREGWIFGVRSATP